MADEKKKDLFDCEKIVLQGKEGFSLPVRYQGQWVRVTKEKPVEFIVSQLAYETKIEIKAAITAQQISLAVMPAPVVPPKEKQVAAEATPQKSKEK